MSIDRQVVVLLGAGASRDAGIPTTNEMTTRVVERIRRLDDPRYGLGLEFVLHTLEADAASRGFVPQTTSPYVGSPTHRVGTDIDVERLFAAVDLLIDRHEQPWSPFVLSWHSGLDALAPEQGFLASRIASRLHGFGRELDARYEVRSSGSGMTFVPMGGFVSHSVDPVTRELANGLAETLNEPRRVDQGSLLRAIRNEMLKSLFEIVHVDDKSTVDHLTPLLTYLKTQRALTIATLNYDRTVEVLCKSAKRACDTGIETWLEGGGLELRATGVRLLKLHGSIDWIVDEQRGEPDEGLPFQRIRKLEPTEQITPDRSPAVVFGDAGKLRSEGPFLELLLKFASELQAAETLLVVGYSFRDTHVNEVIARWFSRSTANRIVVLDPGDMDSHGHASFAARVKSLEGRRVREPVAGAEREPGKPRQMVERTVPGRVIHIPKRASDGLREATRLSRSPQPFPIA